MYKAETNLKKKTDLSDQSLQSLPKLDQFLEVLVADNNLITAIPDLPENLKVLSLSKNKIAFLGSLETAPHLHYLNLSSNRLISLEGINFINSLQELRLSHNYIGDDQILLMQNLRNLRILDVSYNHLKDNRFFDLLESLGQLEELWNSNNDFTEWVINFPMPKLSKLILDCNKIKNIEFGAELSSLQVLSCKENNVKTVKGILNTQNLYEIDLSCNEISELPEDCAKLTRLKVLNLRTNSLSYLPQVPELEVLDVSFNCLTKIELSNKIKELFISHNSISELPHLFTLITADVSYNKLTNLSALSGCSSIQSLNASENPLNSSQVLSNLKNCIEITALDLRGIELSKQVYESFLSSFEKLEVFNGANTTEKNFQQRVSVRTSAGWDNLSKSKLFPSCRSSLNDLGKSPNKNPDDFSMFSDIKFDASLSSSMNSMKKSLKPQENQYLPQDSEYELLAKELEINSRLKKLDAQTKNLGDSLISQEDDPESIKNCAFSEKYLNKLKTTNDSLISKKSSFDTFNIHKKFIETENSENLTKNFLLKPESNELTYIDFKNPLHDSYEKKLKLTDTGSYKYQPISKALSNPLSQDYFSAPQKIESFSSNSKTSVSHKDLYSKNSEHNSSKNNESLRSLRAPTSNTVTSKDYKNTEESTISFEISNDPSKEKPPRKPLKNHEGRSRKSYCKHCCKKKRRSIILQTTLESRSAKSVPKFVDQATSPVNSLLRISPIPSQTHSKLLTDFRVLTGNPPNSHRNYSFFEKSPETNPSFLNENNSNRSYAISPGPSRTSVAGFAGETRNFGVTQSNRALTPLTSYRNTPVEGVSEISQLISYACTPPRPVLASEADTPIVNAISDKGTEFYLISSMSAGEGKSVKKVMKTYTYSLHKSLQIAKHEKFLFKGIRSEYLILFHFGQVKELEMICSSKLGLQAVYASPKNVVLTSSFINHRSQGFQNLVVLVLANQYSLTEIKENIYVLKSFQKVIPAYLVEFISN